jgi:hypothetical protein
LYNIYIPLWDAHVNMRTSTTRKASKVHRIPAMDARKSRIRACLLSSDVINPPVGKSICRRPSSDMTDHQLSCDPTSGPVAAIDLH